MLFTWDFLYISNPQVIDIPGSMNKPFKFFNIDTTKEPGGPSEGLKANIGKLAKPPTYLHSFGHRDNETLPCFIFEDDITKHATAMQFLE